jgi:hypothetical protein
MFERGKEEEYDDASKAHYYVKVYLKGVVGANDNIQGPIPFLSLVALEACQSFTSSEVHSLFASLCVLVNFTCKPPTCIS